MGVPQPDSYLASWKREATIIVHAVPSEAGSAVRNDWTAVINEQASAHVEQIVNLRSHKEARRFKSILTQPPHRGSC